MQRSGENQVTEINALWQKPKDYFKDYLCSHCALLQLQMGMMSFDTE